VRTRITERLKEGTIDQRYGRIVMAAFELRTKGDYDVFIDFKWTEVI